MAQDYAAALHWYRKAGDQGFAKAQLNIGEAYANGRGVTQDYAAAVGWYTKAATLGLAEAQYALSISYETGQGTAQG